MHFPIQLDILDFVFHGILIGIMASAPMGLFFPPPRGGGGHRTTLHGATGHQNFYPRPPRGGRPGEEAPFGSAIVISIHALREEGDHQWHGGGCGRWYFYPRPPRGGRLTSLGYEMADDEISIHALREEGD